MICRALGLEPALPAGRRRPNPWEASAIRRAACAEIRCGIGVLCRNGGRNDLTDGDASGY
jgi:hypothetical protein